VYSKCGVQIWAHYPSVHEVIARETRNLLLPALARFHDVVAVLSICDLKRNFMIRVVGQASPIASCVLRWAVLDLMPRASRFKVACKVV
jgi:hypothetical protein